MFRLAVIGRGWAFLAALLTLVCVVWMPVHGLTVLPNGKVSNRSTHDASAWLSALPRVLTPPAVSADWQLVSLIADDIDADGDLDVVANDGSLDLIVWINDGTGRLSRLPGVPASGGAQRMFGSASANHSTESLAAHIPFSVVHGDTSIASGVSYESSRPLSVSTNPLMPLLISARSPRAPPL